jgi:hypothetical protein
MMVIMNNEKRCPRCGEMKPINEWYFNKGRDDGLSAYCRECMKAANGAAVWARRLEVIDILGGKCVHCGFDDPRALQIDHVDGKGGNERRTEGPHAAMRRILAGDTESYQPLCANCNAIKKYEMHEVKGGRSYARTEPTERRSRALSPEARSETMRKAWATLRADPEKLAARNAKISAAKMGQRHSEESKAKIAETKRLRRMTEPG